MFLERRPSNIERPILNEKIAPLDQTGAHALLGDLCDAIGAPTQTMGARG
jgi:hypothetical protein